MTPESWQNVKALYEAASERDEQERPAFLKEACAGDEELRQRVERMLEQDPSGKVLDRPAFDLISSEEIAVGATLGPYRIENVLGSGGMGAVYRACDTRLGRAVAIKVNAVKFGERFEREARAISSLNHPNICTLHDVGENYLVMELVEGQTLADRIKQGSIPLEESISIARQIADALHAAHEKGIVHRDLKPGNVILKEAGPSGSTVKVLDFGLAKVVSASATADHLDPPPTHMPATEKGVILGTAAYMSPEQARGKPVDKRADIWAFGVVLYEMRTGKPLFARQDLTETLVAVMSEKPDLSQVPDEMRLLLRKCLEKNPSRRLQDIGDWETLLDAGRAQSQLQAADPASDARPAWQRWLWPGVAAAAMLIAAVTSFALWRTLQPEDRPLISFVVELGSDVNLGWPIFNNVVLSPDGTRLVYGAPGADHPGQIYTRPLAQNTAVPLPGTDLGHSLFFSPDGQWIGFTQLGDIKKISVEGGTVIPVTRFRDDSLTFGDWLNDDMILVSRPYEDALFTVPADGGKATVLKVFREGELSLGQPHVLPGGKAVLVTVTAPDGVTRNIDVVTIPNGVRWTVVRGGRTPRYVPTGHLLYSSGSTLFAIRFDLERLETYGQAVPLWDDLAVGTYDAPFTVSGIGTVMYRSSISDQEIPLSTLQWMDRTGKREPVIATPSAYGDATLSPDGQRIALIKDHRVSVYDVETGNQTNLTVEPGAYLFPVWHPNGRFVLFGTTEALFSARADGSGQPERLLRRFGFPGSFRGDGTVLAFMSVLTGTRDIETMDVQEIDGQLIAGDTEPFQAQTLFGEINPAFSLDGDWVAYESRQKIEGREEVSVKVSAFPRPASGDTVQVSKLGGHRPIWSRNRDELFYVFGDRIMVASYHVEDDQFVPQAPRVWAELNGATFLDRGQDGRALIRVPEEEPPTDGEADSGASHQVVLLENFFDELRRRVPVE